MVAVFRSAREGLLQFSRDLHSVEEDRNFLAHVVLPANQGWVAEADGKVVGFVAFANDWINHLYIAPGFQRQGLGQQLLAIAKESSDVLRLWVFQINVSAIAFYQIHGFRIVRRTDGSANEAKRPDVLMEWPAELQNCLPNDP